MQGIVVESLAVLEDLREAEASEHAIGFLDIDTDLGETHSSTAITFYTE